MEYPLPVGCTRCMDRVEIFYQLFITPAEVDALVTAMVDAALATAQDVDPAARCTARDIQPGPARALIAAHSTDSQRANLFRHSDTPTMLLEQWAAEHPGRPAGARIVHTVAATLEGDGLAAHREQLYWAVLDLICPHARAEDAALLRGEQIRATPDEIPWAGGVYVTDTTEEHPLLATG